MNSRIGSFEVRSSSYGEVRDLRFPTEALAYGAILAMGLQLWYGAAAVVFFFLFSATLIAIRPIFSSRELVRFGVLLALPTLAIISTIWSPYPQKTMRGALELFASVCAMIMICRAVRPERLLLISMISFLISALYWLPFIPASFAMHQPLGGQGSKNTQGYLGYVLFALALTNLCDGHQRWVTRILALAVAPYALLIAFLSQSGSAVAAVAITVIVFPPLALLVMVKKPVRITLVIITVALAAISAFFLSDLEEGLSTFRTVVLQKDATLTGRTYLWDFGSRLVAERPWLGQGFGAFWVQGNIDAEGLWRRAGIMNRSGFNFHNELLETRVALGWIGAAILILNCVIIASSALIAQVTRPKIATAGLISLMLISYIRSYVEDGLLSSFNFTTLFWLASFIYSVSPSPYLGSFSFKERERLFRLKRLLDRIPRRYGFENTRNMVEDSQRRGASDTHAKPRQTFGSRKRRLGGSLHD